MEFLSGTVGLEVMREIKNAAAVDIASAYFSPGEEEIGALGEVPELRIYVSNSFDTSDPRGLEVLSEEASVRCIPVYAEEGRFHAKVVSCRRGDGSKVAFVGSANFTGPGLFQNHEACVKLDSRDGDEGVIADVEDWIDGLDEWSIAPDWEQAKSTYESARRRGAPGTSSRAGVETAKNFWVLKTHSGKTGEDYWWKFKSEEVVAIGWERLSLDPSSSTQDEIASQLSQIYDDEGSPSRSAGKILKFVNQWEVGDLVLLCRGFPGNASEDVFFYGYARVEGDFFVDEDDNQRKFKRPATIQEVEINLPKDLYVETLEKGSLRETMHELTEGQFCNFCEQVESRQGVSLKV